MKVTNFFRSYAPKYRVVYLIVVALLAGLSLQAQVEDEVKEEVVEEAAPTKDTRPVRSTFESIWLIDNQTVEVPIKGTFEMDINHRFGLVNQAKYDDLYGVFAASNIRMGFNYVPKEKLQLGFGFTKERKMWDFNAKYALFRQTRSGSIPVSLTYYVNMGWDTRKLDQFEQFDDRFSYFHQIMIARKLTDAFSLQLAPSISYYNHVERPDPLSPRMKNTHFAMAFLGRYKITDVTSIIVNADLPITKHDVSQPKPNLSFGLEFTSSAHAFQIFLGNYQSIMPQHNNTKNQFDFNESQFLIGFNMTRLWNF